MKHEELISLYIDNELSLIQKKEFVTVVHKNPSYAAEVHEFIDQELMLHAGDALPLPHTFAIPTQIQAVSEATPTKRKKIFDHPLVRYGSGWAAAAGILLFLFTQNQPAQLQPSVTSLTAGITTLNHQQYETAFVREYRFLLYKPQAQEVSVVGSFNNWQPIPLTPLGASGYWELLLPLPEGEYAYAFRVDGIMTLPDPTAPYMQPDGFGGVNSILKVGDIL